MGTARQVTKVTIIEALPELLPIMDKECVQLVARKLRKLGVEVLLGARAKGYERKGNGVAVTAMLSDGTTVTKDADHVLVTVGRRPNTDDLGLEALGVRVNDRGFIEVNARQQTRPGAGMLLVTAPGISPCSRRHMGAAA